MCACVCSRSGSSILLVVAVGGVFLLIFITKLLPLYGQYCKFGYFREILFSRIAIKDIFVTFKIRDQGIIYIYQ